MKEISKSVIAGLVIAASLAVGAAASIDRSMKAEAANGAGAVATAREPQPRHGGESAKGEEVEVAVNRLIRIGPRNAFDKWRCAVTINGDRYFATGITETGTRARLQALTNKHIYCRRDRRRATIFF